MWKFSLTDDWRRMHHMASLHLSAGMAAVFALGPALLTTWSQLPDDLKEALPHGWARFIATAGFVLVAGAHYIRFDKADQGGSNGTQ